MTNEQLIKKMKEDMDMRNFSKYTYDALNAFAWS